MRCLGQCPGALVPGALVSWCPGALVSWCRALDQLVAALHGNLATGHIVHIEDVVFIVEILKIVYIVETKSASRQAPVSPQTTMSHFSFQEPPASSTIVKFTIFEIITSDHCHANARLKAFLRKTPTFFFIRHLF